MRGRRRVRRLPVDEEACNWRACPTYAWSAGSWGECNATCGYAGERRRLVQCRAVAPSDDFVFLGDLLDARDALQTGATVATRLERLYDERVEAGRVVPDATCLAFNASSMARPESIEPCARTRCTYHWDVGPWSEPRRRVRGGVKTRHVFCSRRDDLWEEMTESFYARAAASPPSPPPPAARSTPVHGDVQPLFAARGRRRPRRRARRPRRRHRAARATRPTTPAPPPPRPTSRSVVADAVCEGYAAFIGAAPNATAACNTRACPSSPRWDVSPFESRRPGFRARSPRRGARCGAWPAARGRRREHGRDGSARSALRRVRGPRGFRSARPDASRGGALARKPGGRAPDASACAAGADDVCSFAGTCDATLNACVCDEGAGRDARWTRLVGARDGERIASDDARRFLSGRRRRRRRARHTQLGVARLDGALSSRSTCRQPSRRTSRRRTWTRARCFRGPRPSRRARWRRRAPTRARTPPPNPPGVAGASPPPYAPSPPSGTTAPTAPTAPTARTPTSDLTTTAAPGAGASRRPRPRTTRWRLRFRFARAGARRRRRRETGSFSRRRRSTSTAFVIERLEQLEQRSNKAFERSDAPGATDALWNTRARRVLGAARAGVCGDGFCEAGGVVRLRRRRTHRRSRRVVADVDASRRARDAYDMEAVDRGITGWQESVRVVVEAHVERGTGVLGPALARAAAACCPEDCPAPVACAAPEALRRAVRGPRAVPARHRAVRVLPERGVHGRGVRRVRGGVRALAGALREAETARVLPSPAAAPANATAAGGDASLDAADPSAAALRALVGVAAAVLCLCAFGTTCGGCGRLVSRVLRAKEDAEDAEDELGGDEELGKGSFHARADRLSHFGNHDQSGTSPRRKARDAFPPAPVFEFRRARGAGRVHRGGARHGAGEMARVRRGPERRARAVRDGDFLSGAEEEEEEEDSDDPRADSFAGEDANGFFFRNGEREHGQHGHWAMTRGRKPSSVSGGFSETSSQKSARRRPAAPPTRRTAPFPLRGPRGVDHVRFPETRDETRITSHRAAGRDTDTKSRALASRRERKTKTKTKTRRASASLAAAATQMLRAERVAARLKRRLKRPTAAPVAALADWPTAENMSEKIGSEASDSEADADVAGGAETPARGLAARRSAAASSSGAGTSADPVNVAPNADALSDVRDAHATRGLPTAQRGKRSAKPRGLHAAARDGGGGSGADATRHVGRWPSGAFSSGEPPSAVGVRRGSRGDDEARGGSDEYESS